MLAFCSCFIMYIRNHEKCRTVCLNSHHFLISSRTYRWRVAGVWVSDARLHREITAIPTLCSCEKHRVSAYLQCTYVCACCLWRMPDTTRPHPPCAYIYADPTTIATKLAFLLLSAICRRYNLRFVGCFFRPCGDALSV